MPKTHEPRGTKGGRTRERLLGAAISELRRAGVAKADVKAIAASAGVTPGTFYFHFPTKEHVLIELERREEERIAHELTKSADENLDVSTLLSRVVDLVAGLEHRLGSVLFRDFLALHFSGVRPPEAVWVDHPVIVVVVTELRRARDDGLMPADTDPLYSGLFFLVGLYALLITLPSAQDTRQHVLTQYVTTSLHGMRIQTPTG